MICWKLKLLFLIHHALHTRATVCKTFFHNSIVDVHHWHTCCCLVHEFLQHVKCIDVEKRFEMMFILMRRTKELGNIKNNLNLNTQSKAHAGFILTSNSTQTVFDTSKNKINECIPSHRWPKITAISCITVFFSSKDCQLSLCQRKMFIFHTTFNFYTYRITWCNLLEHCLFQ